MSLFNVDDKYGRFRKRKRDAKTNKKDSETKKPRVHDETANGGSQSVINTECRSDIKNEQHTNHMTGVEYNNCNNLPVTVKQELSDPDYDVSMEHTNFYSGNIHGIKQSQDSPTERNKSHEAEDILKRVSAYLNQNEDQPSARRQTTELNNDVKFEQTNSDNPIETRVKQEQRSPSPSLRDYTKREQGLTPQGRFKEEKYSPELSHHEELKYERRFRSRSPSHRHRSPSYPLNKESDLTFKESSNERRDGLDRRRRNEPWTTSPRQNQSTRENSQITFDDTINPYTCHLFDYKPVVRDARDEITDKYSKRRSDSSGRTDIRSRERDGERSERDEKRREWDERPDHKIIRSSRPNRYRAEPYPTKTNNRSYDLNPDTQSRRRDASPRSSGNSRRSRHDESRGDARSRLDNRSTNSERSTTDTWSGSGESALSLKNRPAVNQECRFKGIKEAANSNVGLSVHTISLPSTTAFKRLPGVDREQDTEVLMRRQKQIDYMKVQEDYDTYLRLLPREKRELRDPTTPDKFKILSRRGWDSRIQNWKLQIHAYIAIHSDTLPSTECKGN